VSLDEVTIVHALIGAPAKSEAARPVMIDVGAHWGGSMLPFARDGWRILCFEPDPTNRLKLIEKAAAFASVSVDPRAVSDAPAEAVPFFGSDVSTGISSLAAFHDSHEERATVAVTTLADVAATEGLDRVDFLKIDTEGFDLFVLRGFPWDRLAPAAIVCEFEDAKTVPLGYDYRDLAAFLEARGYTVYLSEWYPIVRYGVRHSFRRLVRWPADLLDSAGWGNFVALRTDPGADRLRAAIDARSLPATPAPSVGPPAATASRSSHRRLPGHSVTPPANWRRFRAFMASLPRRGTHLAKRLASLGRGFYRGWNALLGGLVLLLMPAMIVTNGVMSAVLSAVAVVTLLGLVMRAAHSGP
jgi:FkbM family methyltransferase